MANNEKDDREGKNDLGISKGIYALGHSFKDAFIWGTVATVAAFAVLAVGRKRPSGEYEGNLIHKVADVLEKGHHKFKEGLNWLVKRSAKLIGKEIKDEDAVGPATTATAVIIGSLVGHAVQVPSGTSGYKKAQKAIDRYDDMAQQNARLVETNAALANENLQYRAMMEKKDPSFSERVQKDPETSAVANIR